MKDELRDFIGKNRPAFDDKEPSDKVWRAIEKALPGMKAVSLWNSLAVWRAAAVLMLGLSVYSFVARTPSTKKEIIVASQMEFKDLESFYSSQIAEKVKLINDIEATGESDHFTQDFQKLDAMYQVLLEEMKNHPSEKVKDALVLNMLIRIDLLNQQIKKLEDSRSEKKTHIS